MTTQDWKALFAFLASPGGCNFHVHQGTLRWACDGTLAKTRSWLSLHGKEVAPAIAQLEATGGYCDCECLMNSARHLTS